MKKYSYLIALLGLFVFSGGVIGFIKADSIPSLVMGSSFGLLLLVSAFFVSKNSIPFFYTATFTTIVLHLFFLFRFLKSFKMMPAGMMVLLTTGIGAALISFLTKHVRESSVDAK